MCGSALMCTWSIWVHSQPIHATTMHTAQGTGTAACPFCRVRVLKWRERVYMVGSRAIRLRVSLEQPWPRDEMRQWLSSNPKSPRLCHEASACALFRNSSRQDCSFGSDGGGANRPRSLGSACACKSAHCNHRRRPAASGLARWRLGVDRRSLLEWVLRILSQPEVSCRRYQAHRV